MKLIPKDKRFPVLGLLVLLAVLALSGTTGQAQQAGLRFSFDPKDASIDCGKSLVAKLEIDASIADLRAYDLTIDFDQAHFKPVSIEPGRLIDRADCDFSLTWINEGEPADSMHVRLALAGCSVAGPGEILRIEFVDAGSRGNSSLDLRSGAFEDSAGRSFAYDKMTAMLVNECNHPAAAGNDDYTVNRGGTLSVRGQGLMTNDQDPDGDFLRIHPRPAMLPEHGSLTLHDLGSFEYRHDGSETRLDSFAYKIMDRHDGVSRAMVRITIINENDPPIAGADAFSLMEGGELNVTDSGVLLNDIDPENDKLTLTVRPLLPPRHGRLTLFASGAFDYTHDGGESSADSFVYEIQDGQGGIDSAKVILAIAKVNDIPIAMADTFYLDEGKLLSVPAPGLLVNDTDAEAGGLTLSKWPVLKVRHGKLKLRVDGSMTYEHDGSETTEDTFTYKIKDADGAAAEARVLLKILLVNEAPEARDDAYTLAEGGSIMAEAPGLLGNDTDPENDPLRLSKAPVKVPGSGRVDLGSEGSFTYSHDGSETYHDEFIYEVSDKLGRADSARVNLKILPVNDAPVAASDEFTVVEGEVLEVAAPGVLSNDKDVDGDRLRLRTQPLVQSNHGVLELMSSGGFVYTHDGSESTRDSFRYVVQDGADGSDSSQVFLTIMELNDAPLAAEDRHDLAEGGVLLIEAPGLLANDRDAENEVLSVNPEPELPPRHGRLTLHADGAFRYVHDGGESTEDRFEYRIRDLRGAEQTSRVTLTIHPVNDAPLAVDDRYSMDEGAGIEVSAPGVLTNDQDPDDEPSDLHTTLLREPRHGRLVLHDNGAFDYTHNGSENFTDDFAYRLSDAGGLVDSAKVTLVVTPVNEAPMAFGESFELMEGASLSLPATTLLANDSDTDDDTLSMSTKPVRAPLHGRLTLSSDGAFTYEHDGSETRSDRFDYAARDGKGGVSTATVKLSILPVNDAPQANSDRFELEEGGVLSEPGPGILANDNDAEGDPLILSTTPVVFPKHGILNLYASGAFNYSHDGSETREDIFVYKMTDPSGEVGTARVTLSITPRMDVPIIVDPQDQISREGDKIDLAISLREIVHAEVRFGASGLPPGLSIDKKSGLVSGRIKKAAAEGSPYVVTVNVRHEEGGKARVIFTWTVSP